MNHFQVANNNSFVFNFIFFASFECMRTHTSSFCAFDYNVFVRVIHEIMQNVFSILTFVINVISFSSLNMITSLFISRFEKFLDIIEYDENRNCLNTWKQNLIQRMNANHDRYFINRVKIVYVESRLIIEKKAHNLMSQYRMNDLCTLINFVDWRQKFRHACDNFFEVENARRYFQNELKQNIMSFF